MARNITALVLVGILACVSQVSAQAVADVRQVRAERADTQEELKDLEDQIASYEQELDLARQEEASAMQRLEDIDREIAVRQELVNTYTRRNRQLGAEAPNQAWCGSELRAGAL